MEETKPGKKKKNESYVAWLYIGLPPTHIPRLIFLVPNHWKCHRGDSHTNPSSIIENMDIKCVGLRA
ncbi:hypothetical protein NC653_017690 [Populus alba x Populus x berolinensis]|uniref:Uncharacterized protein n=1 Tax=Populus alba x Populus x berolinensis TaxID=444605 RepID=A0AAD6W1B8_9ROSI|nr:hypothetical protein NC653_017690 [Populus alba x Populus x berolinensis]